MTEQETHFNQAEKITYEALAIAFEKKVTECQEKDVTIEEYKTLLRNILNTLSKMDLSPAKKEDNGMDEFKKNRQSPERIDFKVNLDEIKKPLPIKENGS